MSDGGMQSWLICGAVANSRVGTYATLFCPGCRARLHRAGRQYRLY